LMRSCAGLGCCDAIAGQVVSFVRPNRICLPVLTAVLLGWPDGTVPLITTLAILSIVRA
jgi:hypothetical protein